VLDEQTAGEARSSVIQAADPLGRYWEVV